MSLLDGLKRLIAGRSDMSTTRIAARPIDHPVLGHLVPDEIRPDTLLGRITHGAGVVELRVFPDDKTMDEALALAACVIESLETLDAKGRSLIADDSLGGYNNDWRFGEVAIPNGSTQPFEKPLLTKPEFCAKLKLRSIEASGACGLTFYYDDDDMFWGHGLELTSFDGMALGDVHVSMLG